MYAMYLYSCLLWVVCLPPATEWKFHEGKSWPALLIDVNQAAQLGHDAWVTSNLTKYLFNKQ